MPGRRAEPGDQQRAEFVAVQGDGAGLVVRPRLADVRGREWSRSSSSTAYLQNPAMAYSRRVMVARARPLGLQIPGEARDADVADGERFQGAGPAPGGELAQIESVGLAGQAAVPG